MYIKTSSKNKKGISEKDERGCEVGYNKRILKYKTYKTKTKYLTKLEKSRK